MIYDRECPRCNGSGEVACGVAAAKCDFCGGSGLDPVDLDDEIEDWPHDHGEDHGR